MNPLIMSDGYKVHHRLMYPKGTTLVYSNYTCRSVKRMPEKAKDIVVFGTQYMIMYIQDLWQKEFFDKPKEEVVGQAHRILSSYLGTDYDVSHFQTLNQIRNLINEQL